MFEKFGELNSLEKSMSLRRICSMRETQSH